MFGFRNSSFSLHTQNALIARDESLTHTQFSHTFVRVRVFSRSFVFVPFSLVCFTSHTHTHTHQKQS